MTFEPATASVAPLADEAPHLLLVDDDSRIRQLLSRFLHDHGYRVSTAESAAEARRKLAAFDFDLLVLDVMMPGESGMDLTAAIRAESDVPIVMLTARSEAANRIRGLELGADDYVPKPFEPVELLLRLKNILRRRPTDSKPRAGEVRFGPYSFSLDRLELKRGEEAIRLTDREKQVLKLLAERAGEAIPRHELAGEDSMLGDRTIDVHMNRLRRKIERDPANPKWLQTVRGAGYRLVAD